MADKKYVNDINEILDFVLNDDSDLDVDLGNDTDDFSNTDSIMKSELTNLKPLHFRPIINVYRTCYPRKMYCNYDL